MNQILETKNIKYKLKKIFKIQLIISIISIIIVFIYVLNNNKIKNKESEITEIVNQNAKIMSLFEYYENYKNSNFYNDIYFCTLKIEKINLEYFVYENYSEELLKILPCKFSGPNINEYGNICIIGHNYFDNRFFSNLNKLEIGDEIILQDMQGNIYNYYIYEIYEIDEKEIDEVIKQNENSKILTLCTCTNLKNIRLIVKAGNI